MISYEEFKEAIKAQVKDYLPDEYKDSEIEIRSIEKNNGIKLDGLIIKSENTNIFPTIYLNSYYNDLKDGHSLEDVVGSIAKSHLDHAVEGEFNVDAITVFENVKDKIIPRLLNAAANEDRLKGMPHRKIDDLVVTYHIKLGEFGESDGVATVAISNELMNKFGIDEDSLYDLAISNMPEVSRPEFMSMAKMLAGSVIPGFDDMNEEDKNLAMEDMMPCSESFGMYILTNKEKSFGAASILDNKTMDMISEQIGPFIIIPSSIHELILIKKDENTPPLNELENLVKEVNRTQVDRADLLSDHVYAYDKDTHELYRADKEAEFLEKKQMKEKEPSLKQKLEKNQKLIKEKESEKIPKTKSKVATI